METYIEYVEHIILSFNEARDQISQFLATLKFVLYFIYSKYNNINFLMSYFSLFVNNSGKYSCNAFSHKLSAIRSVTAPSRLFIEASRVVGRGAQLY